MTNFTRLMQLPGYHAFEDLFLPELLNLDLSEEARKLKYTSEEEYKLALVTEAFCALSDYGSSMMSDILQSMEEAIAQNKLPAAISKLKELFYGHKLFLTDKISICDHVVAGVTVRELVRTEVCEGLLAMKFAD